MLDSAGHSTSAHPDRSHSDSFTETTDRRSRFIENFVLIDMPEAAFSKALEMYIRCCATDLQQFAECAVIDRRNARVLTIAQQYAKHIHSSIFKDDPNVLHFALTGDNFDLTNAILDSNNYDPTAHDPYDDASPLIHAIQMQIPPGTQHDQATAYRKKKDIVLRILSNLSRDEVTLPRCKNEMHTPHNEEAFLYDGLVPTYRPRNAIEVFMSDCTKALERFDHGDTLPSEGYAYYEAVAVALLQRLHPGTQPSTGEPSNPIKRMRRLCEQLQEEN